MKVDKKSIESGTAVAQEKVIAINFNDKAIEKFPEHKKVMQKWISISAERHKQFEENINARNSNKLNLSNYYSAKIKPKDNKNKLSGEAISQIKQLHDLYKAGVLTKEEFEKAKKKILN